MLTCKQLAQLHSSDYLDGNLTGWQSAGVRVHLAMCSHCRRLVRQLRLARKVIAARPMPVDDNLARELVVRLMDARQNSPEQVAKKDPPE
jgi:predicted anti-sigma-YlaC factor YlaD